MFYIKKIIIKRAGKDSILLLKPGVNIIYGPSNTGKSMVLDCIDYLLCAGADNHRFDAKLNIESIGIILDVDGEDLSIFRSLNSTKFEVISSVTGIESKKYVEAKGENSRGFGHDCG